MDNSNNDNSVLSQIKKLTEKEEHLYLKNDLTDQDVKELHYIKTELDQYWDRRALREAGKNADKAEIRPADQVENYDE